MAVTPPPAIPARPAPPNPANRATYNALAYPWAASLPANDAAISAVAENVFDNAMEAQASATTAVAQVALAATQAGNAASSAIDAATQAGNSTTQAGLALTSANNAAASAATAASAPGTSATSTTSLVIAVGSKSLTIETGKSIVIGMSVKIANNASPNMWMHGDVTAYNSGTGALVVNVTRANGSGTHAAWTVSLSAPEGVSTYPKQAVTDKAAAYTLTAGDHATTIRTISGTGDITLLASSTAGVGFIFNYINATAAVRYVYRAGSDSFQDGMSSATIPPGASVTISCTTASATGKWQVMETSATGSGSGSTALGSAIASGQNSVALGGNGTATASALGAISVGSGTASGNSSINIGYGNAASASNAVTIGSSNVASASNAIAMGSANIASGIASFCSGFYGQADFYGKRVQGAQSPRAAANGYSQYARTVLSAFAVLINTNYPLTADNSGIASATNIINVPLNRLVVFTATVAAGRGATLGTESAGWEVKGVIRRGSSGNVAFVGTPTVTSLGGTVPTGWTLTATADTTNQGLALVFNMGATAMTAVSVSAAVHASEVAIN
ncbi:hypothetical protein [Undibacterium sp.]|uniref:hypothetical protein n=1 Tax=Undibacterium sp. TaxID=1914977 RepID=UPI003752E439